MRKVCGWVCVVVGCVLLWGASAAFGKEVHLYRSSFGGSGSGTGQFKEPLGVAVNNVTHDVYLVDRGNNRVEEFSAAGTFIREFDGADSPSGTFSGPTEIAVDNSDVTSDASKEDVYVVDRGHGVIDKFNASGIYEHQLTGTPNSNGPEGEKFVAGENATRSLESVAVGTNGSVWVSTHKGPIYSFTDELENKYSSERETPFGGALEGLGVDGESNLYVHAFARQFAKVNTSGDILLNPFGGDTDASNVAVDAKTGEVYLDNFASVEAFSLGGVEIEAFGSGDMDESFGVGVDEGDGSVYVTNRLAGTVSVFEGKILPSVSVGVVSDQSPKGVTLNGTVNPGGSPVTSCVFEYTTSAEYSVNKAYANSVPCSPEAKELGSESNPLVVSSLHLEGLAPETKYDYRLVAENGAGVPSATVNEEVFTGPVLGGEFVSDVTSGSATLQAPMDPNGADTHFYFEYGPSMAYGFYAPTSPPGVDIGSATSSSIASVHLQGLKTDASYHYRLVVVQDGEIFVEPDHTFRTEVGGVLGGLVDGRAWELVSPANKKGALVELLETGGQVQAANDGSGIAYMTEGGSLGEHPVGKLQRSQVLSDKGLSGASTTDLTLPQTLPENSEPAEELYHADNEYHLFSRTLSSAVVEPQADGTPLLSPEATERTLYLRDDFSGSFLPLVSPADTPPETRIEEPNFSGADVFTWEMHFLAATPDLSHVVFRSPMALTADSKDEENLQQRLKNHEKPDLVRYNLYEWGAGALQLVNILPGSEGIAYGHGVSDPSATLAGITSLTGLPRGSVQRAVSSDGRRVAWTWGEPYSPAELTSYRGLFVRDMDEERTVRVGGPKAVYQTMNSDGSKIFFLENGDLYVYDFETGLQTDLTGVHGVGETSAGVQELVSDVSENGSYVYFVATGVLADGSVSGQDNLYLLHDMDEVWSISHVATLSEEDKPDWYAKLFEAPSLASISSRVSPDGRFLAFMSKRSLTGYDNIDVASGEADEEVYLYDAQSERLVCASCDPTGARPKGILDDGSPFLLVDRGGAWTGNANEAGNKETNHWLAGSVPTWDNLTNDPSTYQPRYLLNDGRLFFDSPVGLVAQDTNGLEDVYEFEPGGVGGCTTATGSATVVYVSEVAGSQVDGCVGLMSSGTSSSESAFYDASESGDDVFFDTTSKLVGEDYDLGYDLYDAHVCSSSALCRTESVGAPPCSSGDSCKAAPTPQPEIFGTPPSATFNGAGNAVPPAVASVKVKSLTNAQKLARALKACREKKGKQRAVCERSAHKRYPIKKQLRKKVTRGNGRKG